MIELVVRLIRENATLEFVFHFLLNMAINSFLIIVFYQWSTQFLIANELQIGVKYAIFAKISTILSEQHEIYFLDKHRRQFRSKIHVSIRKYFLDIFHSLCWDDARSVLEKKFNQTTEKVNWSIMGFTSQSVSTFINFFPMIGYSIWILYHSPISFAAFVVATICAIRFIEIPASSSNEYYDIWDKYYVEDDKKFTRLIHHESEMSIRKTVATIEEFESLKQKNSGNDQQYRNKINVILFFVAIIDLYLKGEYSEFDTAFMILYIQYVSVLQQNISQIGSFYSQYKEAKREFDSFNKLVVDLPMKQPVPQTHLKHQIIIENLRFSYPPKEGSNTSFGIRLLETVILECGKIYRLDGDVSNGKSTFMDILSGVIPQIKYTYCVHIDGNKSHYGFESLTRDRMYCEQEPPVSWTPSIYKIISDEDPVIDKDEIVVNQQVEDLVWWSFEQANCADFFKTKKDATDKKWIYTPRLELSPGLKALVRIARAFYMAEKNKPRMIIADELDRAVSPERAVVAMFNLFQYCRQESVLLIISAHTTEVKGLYYDQTLYFKNGDITTSERNEF